MLAVSSAFLLPCPSPHTVAFRRACLKAKSSEPALGDEPDILLRPGRRDDEANIRSTVAKMFMNPLSIDANNFVCAEDHGKLIGFGQVTFLFCCVLYLLYSTSSILVAVTDSWHDVHTEQVEVWHNVYGGTHTASQCTTGISSCTHLASQ